MSTVYDYRYYIHGRQIAIIQRQLDNIHDPYLISNDIMYQTPASSDVSAIQIVCTKKPTAPTDETSTIDLSATLVNAVEAFVKSKLYEDKEDENRADYHMKDFYRKLELHEENLRGSQAIMMTVGPGMIRR